MWPKSTNPPRPLNTAQFTGRRGRMKVFTVESKEVTMRRLAKSYRLFEHRVEHRREDAGRGIDDLQYLSGRGLLLQGLTRLGDQPRILHRDHRLRREIFKQRDLLIGKLAHLAAVH